MTALTELKKDDNSDSSGAGFHILVCRCDININEILSIFIVIVYYYCQYFKKMWHDICNWPPAFDLPVSHGE